MKVKAIQSGPQSASLSRMPVPSEDAQRHKSLFAENFRRGFARLRHLWWFLNLTRYALVSEICSLPGRIQFRLARRLDQTGVDFGTPWKRHPNEHLEPNTRTHARIRDTQCMLAKYPWATPVDLEIFLVGWDRGAEWASADRNNSYTQPRG